jgi:hypothetical protein
MTDQQPAGYAHEDYIGEQSKPERWLQRGGVARQNNDKESRDVRFPFLGYQDDQDGNGHRNQAAGDRMID